MRPGMVLALLAMVMVACSSAPAREATAPAASASAASAPPVAGSEYFHGTSKVYLLPSESPVPESTRHVLVRRSIDPSASRIVEAVVIEGRRDTAEELVVTMTVSGATFTMEERGGAFRGTGTLTGDPWRWTSWTSHSVMPDGATVDSTDRLSGSGLHVEKDYKGPHGSIHLVEDYTRIDRTAYNAHRAQLGVAPDMTP